MANQQYLVTDHGVRTGIIVHYSGGTITFQTDRNEMIQGRVEDFHTNRADATRAYRRRVGKRLPALRQRMN